MLYIEFAPVTLWDGIYIISMDEEQLIEAVRCYPCLWQVSSKSYRDLIAKENAWKEVALQVRTFVRTCFFSCSWMYIQ